MLARRHHHAASCYALQLQGKSAVKWKHVHSVVLGSLFSVKMPPGSAGSTIISSAAAVVCNWQYLFLLFGVLFFFKAARFSLLYVTPFYLEKGS